MIAGASTQARSSRHGLWQEKERCPATGDSDAICSGEEGIGRRATKEGSGESLDYKREREREREREKGCRQRLVRFIGLLAVVH